MGFVFRGLYLSEEQRAELHALFVENRGATLSSSITRVEQPKIGSCDVVVRMVETPPTIGEKVIPGHPAGSIDFVPVVIPLFLIPWGEKLAAFVRRRKESTKDNPAGDSVDEPKNPEPETPPQPAEETAETPPASDPENTVPTEPTTPDALVVEVPADLPAEPDTEPQVLSAEPVDGQPAGMDAAPTQPTAIPGPVPQGAAPVRVPVNPYRRLNPADLARLQRQAARDETISRWASRGAKVLAPLALIVLLPFIPKDELQNAHNPTPESAACTTVNVKQGSHYEVSLTSLAALLLIAKMQGTEPAWFGPVYEATTPTTVSTTHIAHKKILVDEGGSPVSEQDIPAYTVNRWEKPVTP